MVRIPFLLLLLTLASCGEQSVNPAPPRIVPDDAVVAFAREAQPEDDRIARIYNRSCRNCHAVAGVNAPLTGHEDAWAPRVAERGMEGLLHSTKFGYRFMPARGLCANCSDDDYRALIEFMLAPPS